MCLQGIVQRYFHVHLDQCAYGCVHPGSGRPVKKKTKLLSTSPLIYQMGRRCRCQVEHDHAKGGTKITGPLAFYPKQMCMAVAALVVAAARGVAVEIRPASPTRCSRAPVKPVSSTRLVVIHMILQQQTAHCAQSHVLHR